MAFYKVANDCLFSLLQGNARNCQTKSLIKIKTTSPRIFITLKNKKINEKVQVKKKQKKNNPGGHSKLRYTAISRKVVGKNVHATTPKGNMGCDQYTVPNDCSCRTYFGCFPLGLANICPWPLVPFFQISLENRADKTTHNTFQDCRVHFFRQPFSKQLYHNYAS